MTRTPYTATITHDGMTFMGFGTTDHEAAKKAIDALEAVWQVNTGRAILTVRLNDSIQYTTTNARYFVSTH